MILSEKVYDLSVIWRQAAFVFPHFHRCGVDWDDAYREFISRAMETSTDREHALLMAEFLNLLGDGHTDLSIKREILDEAGYLSFELDYVESGYCVDGERVLGFDGVPMAEILEKVFRYIYHVGNYAPRLGNFLPLVLGSGAHTMETEGGTRSFEMTDQRPNPMRRQETEFTLYGDVLRIAFDDLLRNRAPEIRQKLQEVKPRVVILDIRGNIGGMTKFGADIAQLFISGEFSGCKKWTRTMIGVDYASAGQVLRMSPERLAEISGGTDADEIERCLRIANHAEFREYEDHWGDRNAKAIFEGPVVLLTSRKTVSAAEDFAAFFRTNCRGILVGQPTCGTSGTPLILKLNCGTARVCSVGYQLLDGTDFIGKGIQPDVPVEPTLNDVRQGRDVVLEAALRLL